MALKILKRSRSGIPNKRDPHHAHSLEPLFSAVVGVLQGGEDRFGLVSKLFGELLPSYIFYNGPKCQ